jgi:ACS family sodium-dependent inorganic phosphate cotransporter
MISNIGWQYVFYLFGGSALLWLPFWLPLNVLKQLPEDAAAAAAASSSSSTAVSALQQQQQQGMGKDSPMSQSAMGGEEDAPLLQRRSFELDAPSSTTAVAAADGSSSTGFQALLRRREVWAICVCQYAQSYGMYGLLTWLPTFFTDFYGVKLVDLGGYTLLPYVLQVGACSPAAASLVVCGWQVVAGTSLVIHINCGRQGL